MHLRKCLWWIIREIGLIDKDSLLSILIQVNKARSSWNSKNNFHVKCGQITQLNDIQVYKTSMYSLFVKILLFSIEFANTKGMIFSHGNNNDFYVFARWNRFVESHNFDSVRRLQFCGNYSVLGFNKFRNILSL